MFRTTVNFSDCVFTANCLRLRLRLLICAHFSLALLMLILIISARLVVQNKRRDNAFTPAQFHNLTFLSLRLSVFLLSLCCRKSVMIGLAAWCENGTEIKLNIDSTFAPAAFI